MANLLLKFAEADHIVNIESLCKCCEKIVSPNKKSGLGSGFKGIVS